MRRRARRLVIGSVAALAALSAIAFIGWALDAHRALLAEPAFKTDYAAVADEIIREAQPERENAWPWYRDLLIDRYGDARPGPGWPDEDSAKRFTELIGESFLAASELDEAEARAWIDVFEEFRWLLPLLDDAAAPPRLALSAEAVRQTFPRVGACPHPHVGCPALPNALFRALTSLSQYNELALRFAAEQGDWDEAVRRFETGLRHSRQIAQLGVVGRLLGRSARRRVLFEAQLLAGERDIPEDVAERMARLAEELAIPEAVRRAMFEVALLADFDELQWRFGPGPPDDSVFVWWAHESVEGRDRPRPSTIARGGVYPPPSIAERLGNIRAIFSPRWGEVARGLETWRVEALEWSHPPFDPSAAPPVPPAPLDELPIGQMIRDSAQQYPRRGLASGTPAAAHVIALRLEAFHARTGRWPARLTDAMSADDASDPLTGEMFEYALNPSGDPRQPFLLWAGSGFDQWSRRLHPRSNPYNAVRDSPSLGRPWPSWLTEEQKQAYIEQAAAAE